MNALMKLFFCSGDCYHELSFTICSLLYFIKCIYSSLYGIHVNKPSDLTNGGQFTD